MMNLKEMTVTEAVRAAKEASGKTKKEIADALGISRCVITRYLKENDDYSPRMGMIPDLCHAREKMLLHVGKMKKALEEATLLLVVEEEMAVEDEEEVHDLINKVERECQRLAPLLPRARYQNVPGEKSAGRAAGTMRQARHDRKR